METPTDMEIVRRVQTGDAEAFGELVNRYSGRIYALALAMVRDAQRAEDVTQEAFIRAYEHLDGFRGASAFGTWLYRIAYNRAAGECRRRGLRPYRCRILCGGRGIVRRTVRRGDGRADAPCVGTASSDERVLVTLFYEEERSLAEIAQIMNLTLSNVKVRLHRLRGRLRHYMEE